jgi:hypothetical protein
MSDPEKNDPLTDMGERIRLCADWRRLLMI